MIKFNMNSRVVFTKEQNLIDIANAIRLKTGTTAQLKAKAMADEIKKIGRLMKMSVDFKNYGQSAEWVKPVAWPDIQAINIDYDNDEEVLYLTYDNTEADVPKSFHWAGFAFTINSVGAHAIVDRGTVSNGVFTVTSTVASPNVTSTTGYVQAYDFYGDDPNDYVVYRIRPSAGNFTRVFFNQIAAATSGLAKLLKALDNLCVHRYGNLPFIISLAESATTAVAEHRWGCKTLQYDAVRLGHKAVLRSLQGAWRNCFSLVGIDFTGWNTTNWNVESLNGTWYRCYSLRKLDLDLWDTTNWVTLTTLADAWRFCINLKELPIDNWNTANWGVVSTLAYTFAGCHSLKHLDLSKWNVSRWNPTTMAAAFSGCYSLETLDISTWNTAGWTKLNNISSCWSACYTLKSLDTSNWNTSNWVLSDNGLQTTWSSCTSLEELDLSNWNTAKWTINTLSGTFQYCRMIDNLDLSNWDTSKWTISSLYFSWYYCASLQHLNISTWNTTNWNVRNFSQTWTNCYSLQELNLNSWNTSNWHVTTLLGCWMNCFSLSSLYVSNWNTTNWTVITLSTTWQYCYSLRNFDPMHWNTTNWTVSSLVSTFAYCWSLPSMDLSKWTTSNWNPTSMASTWASCYSMKTLDVHTWNTSGWTKMASFNSTWSTCKALESLDISAWDKSNFIFTNFANMFYECNSIECINLGTIDFSRVSSTSYSANVFTNAFKLKTYIGGIPNLKYSVAFGQSFDLSRESILSLFSTAGTPSSTKMTLQLAAEVKHKFTAAEENVLKNKNWNAVSYSTAI